MKITKKTKQALLRLINGPSDKSKSKLAMKKWSSKNIRSGKLGMQQTEALADKELDVALVCNQCNTFFKDMKSYKKHNKNIHRDSFVNKTLHNTDKQAHASLEDTNEDTEKDVVSVDIASGSEITVYDKSSEQEDTYENDAVEKRKDSLDNPDRTSNVGTSKVGRLNQVTYSHSSVEKTEKVGYKKILNGTCECCGAIFQSRRVYEEHLAKKFFGSLP